MTTNELRSAYLHFFEQKGHAILPSARLVPDNDPTTLFTGSGMQPMLPYFLGEVHPRGQRVTDSQKCFRTVDIEEVGDNRHTTFFEMLGNWSFGDYFKGEQIDWMWEFLTKELGIDPNRLSFTCFRGAPQLDIPRDSESAERWQKHFLDAGIEAKIVDYSERDGMQGGRIFYYDEMKNWWSRAGIPDNMPVGEPGGPDTEMFFDFRPDLGDQCIPGTPFSGAFCHVNCDCGRFMEIGNNVFMQYQKTTNGFEELAKQNVDFGGGLERLLAAANDTNDVIRLDMFDTARHSLEALSGISYGTDAVNTYAMRVILDHLRAATFLIGDGISPSNKDQGYFVRRLIRRSVRFALNLGITSDFSKSLGEAYIATYADTYPDLLEKKDSILAELSQEELKFRKTLENGLREFSRRIESHSLSGKDAFDLFTTYGFPLEMTQELAEEKNITIDAEEFRAEFKNHQELSRTASQGKFKGGLSDHGEMSVKYHTATHLLDQALREVLGTHVMQKGSNITPERLRFDFSHPNKMTDEEKARVEEIVNRNIAASLPVTFEDLPLEIAKKKGAIGLFGEKYGDIVRVYSIGDVSVEFCGGPHVGNTGTLGHFRIQKEESSSAGIRRIKAVLV